MAISIRLSRGGSKKRPYYRIVVADARSPRDGKFIEIIGQYAPRTGEQALNLQSDRVNYWLDSGAQPTDTVRSLLRRAGILKQRHEARLAEPRRKRHRRVGSGYIGHLLHGANDFGGI